MCRPEKSRPKRNDDTATLHFFTSIRPPGHHADPFFPIVGTGIGPAHAIGIDMCQLTLDRVRAPEPDLVQHRGGGRSEAVPSHLILAEPEPAQGRVDRVLAHAPFLRTDVRKEELAS